MIKRHLSNILGKTTDRHLLAFFIDDYGAIINHSKEAQMKMFADGYNINKSRFTQYDCLETNEDMEALFDVLTFFTDINGKNVSWTPLALPANPDFEKIRLSNYSQYYYKTLDQTLSELNDHDKVYSYIREGINQRIFVPQFHGREHINIKLLMDSLQQGVSDAIITFKNNSLCSFKSVDGKISSGVAFKYKDNNELSSYNEIIIDGLNCFEKVYGYRAIHFNAPGERESSKIDKVLFDNGIQYIETDKIKKDPTGNGNYRRNFHWNGQLNQFGQRYIIRNCVFEPTVSMGGDWAEYTFKQIEIAFKWKKPAIVSGHRVNFSGGICSKNRKEGLDTLKRLLLKVQNRFGDVEFVCSEDLFKIMYD